MIYIKQLLILFIPFILFSSESFTPLTGKGWAQFCEWRLTETEDFDPKKVQRGDAIFVDYPCLKNFKYDYIRKIKRPFILVTPQSQTDHPMPGFFGGLLKRKELAGWFLIHIDCEATDRIIPIPIGFRDPNGIPLTPPKGLEKLHLAYLNFTENTCLAERSRCASYFRKINEAVYSNPKPYEEYLEDLASSRFVVSPRGNGLDCFRTWEALAMGSYPIVRTSTLDPLFQGLPVVIVEDWDQVTKEFLEEKEKEFASKNWSYEKLYTSYWVEKMRSLQKKIRSQRRSISEWFSDTFQRK